MSAYYAVAYADRVELVTDGAIYADDGTVMDIREKVWRSARLPMAFAGRGDDAAIKFITLALQTYAAAGTVDECLARFAKSIDRCRIDGAIPVDGLIASVSDDGVPQLHWFTTFGDFEGFEPFTLYNVSPEFAGGPQPSEETLAAWGFPERMADSTLAESGADLFEAMRQTQMPHLGHPDRPLVYGVGCHVDLTVVDGDGARTRQLANVVGRCGG